VKTISRIIKDAFVCGILGLVVEAVAGVKPEIIFIGGGLLASLRIAYLIWDEYRREINKKRRVNQFNDLQAPDPVAETFSNSHGGNKTVVGKVIEIWGHRSLQSKLPIGDQGVQATIFKVRQPTQKDFSESLRLVGGLKEFPPPNKKKYGIQRLPSGTMDDEDYTIEFSQTDWNTWMSVRPIIEKNVELRHSLSSLLPQTNKLPQSTSLHFVVRFSNGDVLALKRGPDVKSEANKWSFSGEEQLDEEDFKRSYASGIGVIEQLFRRSFIEEVFGNQTEDDILLAKIWNEDCDPIIHSHQIWSFFLEENTGIFQIFGVFQLKIDPDALRLIHEKALISGWGCRDPEGALYLITEKNIENLLTEGKCQLAQLHGERKRLSVSDDSLHATSRYRLWRIYIAANRKAETLTALMG
jgi:hypothetical protein